MNIQDIKTYLKMKVRIEEELNNLCSNIFSYVKDKYVEQLEFGRFSRYHTYFVNKESICIEYYEYGYDCHSEDYLPDIPLELLESETSWQKFLDDYYEKKKKEKEEKKAKEEQAKENKEREIYERLKKKFGNETV